MPLTTTPTEEEAQRGFISTWILDFHNRTVLFRIGNWVFTTYAFLSGTAIATGFAVILWFNAMHGMDAAYLAKVYVFLLVPPVLVGLRAFSVMLEWRELFRNPIATLVKPGYMYHGGLAGGFVGFLAICTIVDIPLMRLLDACALALPLAEAIARLGCYVYGCCWGRPTRGRWGARFGVRYTSKESKVVRAAPHLENVKIHPAQLYALVIYLGLFAAFYALLPHLPFDGALTAIYLIGHSITRISLEHFRQDDRGRLWGKLTHTNMYSAVMILGGIFALIYGAAYGARSVPDMSIRLVHVLFDPSLLPWIVLCGLIFGFAYGVHYKKVGSWIQRPDPSCSVGDDDDA